MYPPEQDRNLQYPYLPKHYQKLYISFIRLACSMIFAGLLTGILFRESTRHLTYAHLNPGPHWESVYHLALVHGHTLLIGVVVPIIVLIMLHLSQRLGANPVSEAFTRWGGFLYHLGAGMTILLLLYKGYHYILSVRSGMMDFSHIEDAYFGGYTILKQGIYGLAHTALGTSLCIFSIGILKNLPRKKEPG